MDFEIVVIDPPSVLCYRHVYTYCIHKLSIYYSDLHELHINGYQYLIVEIDERVDRGSS